MYYKIYKYSVSSCQFILVLNPVFLYHAQSSMNQMIVLKINQYQQWRSNFVKDFDPALGVKEGF